MTKRWTRVLALACAASILPLISTTRAADKPPQGQSELLKDIKGPKAGGWDFTILSAAPDAQYPTSVNSTPWGEIFITTDGNAAQDKNPDRGWVSRCIDDGTGKATKFTQFVKVDSARASFNDGDKLYVLHPNKITAYKINPETGTADAGTDIVVGVATTIAKESQDHSCNGLRMGIDGWLYIASGDYGALKAVSQKDGQAIQLHGGGIMRVRPDGTEMEIFVRGTRNIYDVAISPTLDFFTRDNTNDGGGWNTRISHMANNANMGYPSLFKHFTDETLPTMADVGGGSATGSCWVCDPLMPKGINNTFYSNDWGTSWTYTVNLEPDGANYKLEPKHEEEQLIHCTNPTGIDEDGQGHLYISSWKGAVFRYSGPNAGYVLRATPTGLAPQPKFPHPKTMTDDQLITLMASPAGPVRLQVQQEMLRRGEKPAFVSAMQKLATSGPSIDVKVAAIFTLKQMQGVKSHEFLLTLVKNDELREYAIHALADRKKECADLPTAVFTSALADPNPRVRLQAVIAIGRIGKKELADALLPMTADKDYLVAHVAVNTLAIMDAYEACFKAIDSSSSPAQLPGAFMALRQLHEEPVVSGLIDRLAKVQDPTTKELAFKSLCRLSNIEAEWDGNWWHTGPDTTGPYYKPAKWAQTDKINAALAAAFSSATDDAKQDMSVEAQKNRVSIPGLAAPASNNPKYLRQNALAAADRGDTSEEALGMMHQVAGVENEKPADRAKLLRGMLKGYNTKKTPDKNLDNLVTDLGPLAANDNSDAALKAVVDEFIHDNLNGNNADYFLKLGDDKNDARRDLASSVLIYMSGSTFTPRAAKTKVNASIVQAWKKPKNAVSMLHAIARLKDESYDTEVHAALRDSDPEVQKAAAATLAITGPKTAAGGAALIETMTYDDVHDQVLKLKGDAAAGQQLFSKLGCINCHTVNLQDPPKGPCLAGIGQKYPADYLVESVLKPSAKIAQGFEPVEFVMNDGTKNDGFIVHESGNDVEIRNIQGLSTVLAKKDIKDRVKLENSIMPNGLADKLPVADFASLIAYLESLPAK